MRMFGEPGVIARPIVDRTHLIEQQEWIDSIESGYGKGAVDFDAAAFERVKAGDRLGYCAACSRHQ
jgi:hypothetical protein